MKPYRILLTVVFCLIILQQDFAQQIRFENGYWMPSKFITTINNSHNTSNQETTNDLKPITAIVIKRNGIYVKAYGSDFNFTKFKIIDKNKIYLKTIMVNLAPPPQHKILPITERQELLDNKFYLYRGGSNSMYLVVKGIKSIDTIVFTNCIDRNPIISDELVSYQALLNRKFDLQNDKGVVIDNSLIINTGGTIIGSSILSEIQFKSITALSDDYNRFGVLSKLKFKNNNESKSVVLQFDGSIKINVYEYTISKDYLIILKNLLYTLNGK